MTITSLTFFGDILLAGATGGKIFISTNKGASWIDRKLGLFDEAVTSIAFMGKTLFASTNGRGIFKSLDSAKTWQSINVNLNDRNVKRVMVKDNLLIAGTTRGIYISSDKGNLWSMPNIDNTSPVITGMTMTPDGNIYTSGVGRGIQFTRNNGFTWISMYEKVKDFTIHGLLVSGEKLIAGIRSNGIAIARLDGQAIELVSKGILNTHINDIVATPTQMFACTSKQVWQSGDKGKSWSNVSKSLNLTEYEANLVVLYTLSSYQEDVLLGTSNGILKYDKSDSSWFSLSKDLRSKQILSISINYPNMYASGDKSVFQSSDNGRTWTEITYNLPRGTVSLVFKKDSLLMACVNGGSIFRLENKTVWREINKGLGINSKTVYSYSIADKELYISTSDGFYTSTDQGSNWVKLELPVGANGTIFSMAKDQDIMYLGSYLGVLEYNLLTERVKFVSNFTNNWINSLVLSNNVLYAGTGGSSIYSTGLVITSVGKELQQKNTFKLTILEQILHVEKLETTYGETGVILCDAMGRSLYEGAFKNHEPITLPKPTVSGIYLLKIYDQKGSEIFKISF